MPKQVHESNSRPFTTSYRNKWFQEKQGLKVMIKCTSKKYQYATQF